MRNELISQRNAAFLRTYRHLRHARSSGDAPTATQAQIIDEALRRPAPYYYVSYPLAIRNIHRLRQGRPIPGSADHRALFAELLQRIDALRQRPSRRPLTDGQALSRILADGHASRIFLNRRTAARILQRSNNENLKL